MNRYDFIKLIEGGIPDGHNVLSELISLVNTFPYFQSAHILLLKGLQETADVKFENQLRSSALNIANREVLYYYLKKEPDKVNVSINEPPGNIINEDDKVDTQQVVIDIAKNSAEFINEIEKNDSSKKSDANSKGYSIKITAESDDKDSYASLVIVNEESGEIEERVVYMDPGFSLPEQEDLLEIDTEFDNISNSEESMKLPEEKQIPRTISDKQLQSDLIDRFIIANPKIEPVKEKSDTPLTDISKPFIEEREGFLSETLAGIYIKQGYYSKAIDIYERLSLKYPEKSSYFASLILKVKELIKK